MPLGKLSVVCIRNISKTKSKPARKNTGWCFSTEMKATCKNSANLEQETKTTKIVTYPLLSLASSIINWDIQYCAKVMQAKCANFVLCSCDFSSDNLLEQRAIFLRSFVQLKKIRGQKINDKSPGSARKFRNILNGSSAVFAQFSFSDWCERSVV